MKRRRAGAAGLLTLGLSLWCAAPAVIGCASVLPRDEATNCHGDSDCQPGFICAADQGSTCVLRETPQLSTLALVLEQPYVLRAEPFLADQSALEDRSRSLATEIHGCDSRVYLDETHGVIRVRDGRQSKTPVELTTIEHLRRVSAFSMFCDRCAHETEQCLESTGTVCVSPVHAELSVSRPGRTDLDFARPSRERLLAASGQWSTTKSTLAFEVGCTPVDAITQHALGPAPLLSSERACSLRVMPKSEGAVSASAPAGSGAQQARVADVPRDDCGFLFDQMISPSDIENATRSRLSPRALALAPHPCHGDATREPTQLQWRDDPSCRGDVTIAARYQAQLDENHRPRGWIQLSHAEPVATHDTLGLPDTIACNGDDDCRHLGTNIVCNPELGSCGLDLEGRPASHRQPVELVASQDLGIQLHSYTYCSDPDPLAPPSNPKRQYELEYRPVVDSQAPHFLPELRVPITTQFVRAEISTNSPLRAESSYTLCLPPWTPAAEPRVVAPQSAELVESDAGRVALPIELLPGVRCCDADCLQDANDLPESCDSEFSLEFQRNFSLDAESHAQWRRSNCTLPEVGVPLGRYAQTIRCSAQDCSVHLPVDATADDCLEFDAELRRPARSVYRSQRYTQLARSCPDDRASIDLHDSHMPRVILRGEVVCSPDLAGECDVSEAVVMAERLAPAARAEDLPTPLDPYFFHQRVRAVNSKNPRRAEFALPVEPGHYVVTVLQSPGAVGGPASFRVLDLRDQGLSPLVRAESSGRVWATQISETTRFEIEPGVPLRVDLSDGFDHDLKALALDVHPGPVQATHPELCPPATGPAGCPLNLNLPTTCYPEDRGCQIRTLMPPIAVSAPGTSSEEFVGTLTDLGRVASFTQRRYDPAPGVCTPDAAEP